MYNVLRLESIIVISLTCWVNSYPCRHVRLRREMLLFLLFLWFGLCGIDSTVRIETSLRGFNDVGFHDGTFTDIDFRISLESVFDAFGNEEAGINLPIDIVECIAFHYSFFGAAVFIGILFLSITL